jgi:hypothetical protein
MPKKPPSRANAKLPPLSAGFDTAEADLPDLVLIDSLQSNESTAIRPRHGSAPVVRADRVTIPATIGRRAIAFALAGATELGERWTDEAKDSIVMRDGDSTAEVVLVRPMAMLKSKLSEQERAKLAEAHLRWREIDQVTLDVLVNNVVENEPDARRWWYLKYDQMLDARGLKKRKKTEMRADRSDTGATYTAGHRGADREEQHQSVLRVVNMGAHVIGALGRNKTRRTAMIPPTIELHGFEYDLVTGSAIGIWYELGAWVDALALRTDPRIPAIALTYDPYREVFESRLARLLTILLANSAGEISPTVNAAVREIRAPIGGKHAMAQILRFHKALDTLVRDGVIGSWKINPSLSDSPLPARAFVADWLARRLYVRAVTASADGTAGDNRKALSSVH